MAITLTSGSASISTAEYSIVGSTTSGVPLSSASIGVFQFLIDFRNMASGDQYRVKLYERVYAAASQSGIEEWYLSGPQAQPLFVTPSFILGEGWDITAIRTAGSDRTIFWSLRKVA